MAIFNNPDNNKKLSEKEQREPQIYQMEEPVTEEERLNDEIRKTESEIDLIYAEIGREYYEKNLENPLSDEMSARFGKILENNEKIQELNDQVRALKGITTCEQCGADVLISDTFCPNCGARIISEVTISPIGGRCPNCGHEVKPGQLFCTTCGAKVTVSEDILPDDIESEETKIFEPRTKHNSMPEPSSEESVTEDVAEELAEEGESEHLKEEGSALPESATEELEWENFQVPDPGNEEEPEPEFETKGSAPKEKQRCPQCGEELEAGMRFCLYCGAPLDATANEEDEQSNQQPDQQKANRCPLCGQKLEPGDLYCINCGAKIE